MIKIEHLMKVLSELQVEYIYDLDIGPNLRVYVDKDNYLEFGYDPPYGFIYTGRYFTSDQEYLREIGEEHRRPIDINKEAENLLTDLYERMMFRSDRLYSEEWAVGIIKKYFNKVSGNQGHLYEK